MLTLTVTNVMVRDGVLTVGSPIKMMGVKNFHAKNVFQNHRGQILKLIEKTNKMG